MRVPVSFPLGALAALVLASGAVAQLPDFLPAFGPTEVMIAMRRAATHRIYLSAEHPSHVALPVLAE